MNSCLASMRSLLSSMAVISLLFGVHGHAQSSGDFDRGMAEFRAGHFSSAAALFANAEYAFPGATDALLYRAKSLVHLQDFSGAEQALDNYITSHHDSSDALYMLGFVLNRENRPAESLASYTKAAAITDPSADDLKIVGLDYVLLDDYTDAVKWLEKAVAMDPNNKDAWYYLGRAYYTRSRLVEARNAFHKVLELDPHDAKAENSLGLIFESAAQPEAAVDAYRKAIAWQELSPHPNEQPYLNLGTVLMEQGREEEAVEPLARSVALAPDNAYCHLRLGTAYLRTRQLDRARRELEKATRLDPENASAHYQLGRLYKEIHALDRARAEFDRAAELQARAAGSMSSSAHR